MRRGYKPEVDFNRHTRVHAWRRTRSFKESGHQHDLFEFYNAHPELQQQEIQNPYAQQPRLKPYAIRARVIAEPERAYDQRHTEYLKELKHKPAEERGEAIESLRFREVDMAANMSVRLIQKVQQIFHETIADESFWKIPEEELYNQCIEAAFGTTDIETINSHYSQLLRRAFRLAIVNFIDGRKELHALAREVTQDPKKYLEDQYSVKLEGAVSIEIVPVGIILFLQEKDFQKIYGEGNKAGFVGGFYSPFGDSFEDRKRVSNGRLMFVKAAAKKSEKSEAETQSIRKHELHHAVFELFYTSEFASSFDSWKLKENIKIQNENFFDDIVFDYVIQSVIKDSFDEASENVRTEIASYFSDGHLLPALSSMGVDFVEKGRRKIEQHMKKSREFTERRRQIVRKRFFERYRTFLHDIGSFTWMVERLEKDGTEIDGSPLSEEKKIALIHLTPLSQGFTFAPYVRLFRKQARREYEDFKEELLSRDWFNDFDYDAAKASLRLFDLKLVGGAYFRLVIESRPRKDYDVGYHAIEAAMVTLHAHQDVSSPIYLATGKYLDIAVPLSKKLASVWRPIIEAIRNKRESA